jgi:hypothetical protein
VSEVSNADIYNVLINMRGDMGRLEGKLDGHAETLARHIEDDDRREIAKVEAIRKLELIHAKQRGFVAAISTLGAICGAVLGAAADYFSRGHGPH